MARKQFLVGGAAALVAAAVIASCTSSKDLNMQTASDPLFQSYVSLGNSITAGYQSGGITDTTQRQSYANLFAIQAGTRFAMPLMAFPGCAPPIDSNLATGPHRLRPPGYPPSTDTTCYARIPSSVTPVVNNVAVPGAASVDPMALSSANSNPLTMFFLGGQTQVQRAAQANPTFVSMWIGNNDVLAAALSGVLVPVPGVSPGVTSQTTFVANYKSDISGLLAIPTLKGGALFAVVDVTNAPLLFHSNLLFVPAVLAGFEAASGQAPGTITVDASCASPVPLISFLITGAIATGKHRPSVTCTPTPQAGPYPLDPLYGQVYVLDVNEVPAVLADITNFNTYIQAKADTLGWAYVDVNPALAALKAAGDIPIFPQLAQPDSTFGKYFTLDGVHPSKLAHKLVADTMIAVVNRKYGTGLTAVP